MQTITSMSDQEQPQTLTLEMIHEAYRLLKEKSIPFEVRITAIGPTVEHPILRIPLEDRIVFLILPEKWEELRPHFEEAEPVNNTVVSLSSIPVYVQGFPQENIL